MSNRVYLLIALAFVIGGPLVVSFISDVLPPAGQQVEQEIETTAAETSEPSPEEHIPPAPHAEEQLPSSSEPAFDAAPSLDTDAIASEISADAPLVQELSHADETAGNSQSESGNTDLQ